MTSPLSEALLDLNYLQQSHAKFVPGTTRGANKASIWKGEQLRGDRKGRQDQFTGPARR